MIDSGENVILETDRLILRPWIEEDAPSLYSLASDPRIGFNAGWLPHQSLSYSLTIIRMIYSKKNNFAIVPKKGALSKYNLDALENTPIGNISLTLGPIKSRGIKENEAELGYWIGVPFWGKGLAKEAAWKVICYGFCNRQFAQLWCCYADGNERSKQLMTSLGFEWNHTVRESYNAMLKKHQTEHFNKMSLYKFISLLQKSNSDY